jgi:FkbM family methyltransferase
MAATLEDLFMMTLAQQAALHDLSTMRARAFSARCLAEFFTEVLGELKVTCTAEVGAHEASFSLAAREKYPDAAIFAWEGNPHVWKKYAAELTARGIHYENALIGDSCGERTLSILRRIDGKEEPRDGKRHSMRERIGHADIAESPLVPCRTLDSVFSGPEFARHRFCLWIDAEGAGGEVLRGAEATLSRAAALLVEVESVAKWRGQALDRDIAAFLLERDFLPLLRDFPFAHQYNILFVRKDAYADLERAHHQYLQRALYTRVKVCSKAAVLY